MKKTILVVDDEPMLRKETAHVLRRIGFNVVEAENGNEAFQRLKADPSNIAAVISDNNMPKMTGEALLEKMRDEDVLKGIPFGLMTAMPSSELQKKVEDLGGLFLEKPVGAAALRELARTLVPLI